jgi:hypothetical protein
MNYQLNFILAGFCSLLILGMAAFLGEQWWWLLGIVAIVFLMSFRSWMGEVSTKSELLFLVLILLFTFATLIFI